MSSLKLSLLVAVAVASCCCCLAAADAPAPNVAPAAASGGQKAGGGFRVGIGHADVTGPAADVNLLGYAILDQTARGLHTRQYARAFLVMDDSG